MDDRLTAFVVHGSAVTGFIPSFSDFDFVIFSHGKLALDDAFDIQRSLSALDSAPFSYLQLSRLVDLDDPLERRNGLIEDAFVVVHGSLPTAWSLHSPELLRERGLEALRRIAPDLHRLSKDWSVANAWQRPGLVRYLATILKPAVRGLLCELGDPVLDVWRSPYPVLARRLEAHDTELGASMISLIGLLPPEAQTQDGVARRLFSLLGAVQRRAASLE